jgi:hypothetical protein
MRRLSIALNHPALAVLVHDSQLKLCFGDPLVRSFRVPPESFHIALRHAAATFKNKPHVGLRK